MFKTWKDHSLWSQFVRALIMASQLSVLHIHIILKLMIFTRFWLWSHLLASHCECDVLLWEVSFSGNWNCCLWFWAGNLCICSPLWAPHHGVWMAWCFANHCSDCAQLYDLGCAVQACARYQGEQACQQDFLFQCDKTSCQCRHHKLAEWEEHLWAWPGPSHFYNHCKRSWHCLAQTSQHWALHSALFWEDSEQVTHRDLGCCPTRSQPTNFTLNFGFSAWSSFQAYIW